MTLRNRGTPKGFSLWLSPVIGWQPRLTPSPVPASQQLSRIALELAPLRFCEEYEHYQVFGPEQGQNRGQCCPTGVVFLGSKSAGRRTAEGPAPYGSLFVLLVAPTWRVRRWMPRRAARDQPAIPGKRHVWNRRRVIGAAAPAYPTRPRSRIRASAVKGSPASSRRSARAGTCRRSRPSSAG